MILNYDRFLLPNDLITPLHNGKSY